MNNRLAITMIENGKPNAPLVLRGDYDRAIAAAREYGFNALEIHVIDPEQFDCERVRSLCASHSLEIAAIVTGQIYVRRGLSLVEPDLARRRQARAEVERYIDIAEQLQARDGVVIGWVRGRRPEGDDGSYDARLAESLMQVAEYAQPRGQKILLEVINRYETNVFNTIDETLAFIDRHSLPNVFIHADTFHMNIEEADPAASLRRCGGRLGYIHFADSNRLYPGAGHIDFRSVLQALADIRYAGSLSLECIPWPDSRTAALEGIGQLKSLIRETAI